MLVKMASKHRRPPMDLLNVTLQVHSVQVSARHLPSAIPYKNAGSKKIPPLRDDELSPAMRAVGRRDCTNRHDRSAAEAVQTTRRIFSNQTQIRLPLARRVATMANDDSDMPLLISPRAMTMMTMTMAILTLTIGRPDLA